MNMNPKHEKDLNALQASQWKQHRSFILELLDCFIKEQNFEIFEKSIKVSQFSKFFEFFLKLF